MRIAILSDIHANLDALERSLEEIERVGVDAIYCLGDVVGYNADPAPCVERVRAHCDGIVMGNHDAGVAQEEGLDVLPPDGQAAARHHRTRLSPDQIDFLSHLPLKIQEANCTFVHASPDAPAAWKRLTSYPSARRQFEYFDTDVCFVGHTHVPTVMADRLGVFEVRPNHRYIVNVGSVGQPRDQNPKLSFGLFDTETFEYRNVRLEYDVSAAAEKIQREDGLPDRLADRLRNGT